MNEDPPAGRVTALASSAASSPGRSPAPSMVDNKTLARLSRLALDWLVAIDHRAATSGGL
jgi:hypothetical protein